MSIPERLKAERKSLKLTQIELSEKMGISRLMYHRFENGSRTPNALHLLKMREIGIDIWFVLTGQTQTPQVDSPIVDGANNLNVKLVFELGAKPDMGVLSEMFQNSYKVSFTKVRN